MLDLTDDEDETEDDSKDWLNLVDRGGLNHVTDTMYLLIASMELEVRQHLRISDPQTTGITETVMKGITENEDVLFYWSMVSVNWAEEESRVLLGMIADLYITIRGFSFASAWMERYKQAHKKTVEKSKGLRKQLL